MQPLCVQRLRWLTLLPESGLVAPSPNHFTSKCQKALELSCACVDQVAGSSGKREFAPQWQSNEIERCSETNRVELAIHESFLASDKVSLQLWGDIILEHQLFSATLTPVRTG